MMKGRMLLHYYGIVSSYKFPKFLGGNWAGTNHVHLAHFFSPPSQPRAGTTRETWPVPWTLRSWHVIQISGSVKKQQLRSIPPLLITQPRAGTTRETWPVPWTLRSWHVIQISGSVKKQQLRSIPPLLTAPGVAHHSSIEIKLKAGGNYRGMHNTCHCSYQ